MASKNNEVTTSFNVDITDLKKGIQEANRQIRLANAEFKAASSGMDNWQKSTDGVSSKITQLDKVLSGQNKILDSYKQQLALIVAEQGENSKGADEMRIKIANQQAAVNKTAAELEKYKSVLSDLEAEQNKSADATNSQSNAYEGLKSTISEQESKLESLKQEYANTVIEQGKSSDAADRLAQEIEDLSGELSENKKALNDAESAADELDKSLDDVGDSADDVSSGGLSTFTVALGNLAANVISSVINKMTDLISTTLEVGANFETSMANVQAISGATDDELQLLSDTAKEFGSSTQFSASEAADALSYMALAGWDAQTSCDALGGVLSLAAASGMDLAAASDMVTDYMSAFGMEAEQSAYFADLLAYAQSNANTTAAGLGEAFKNCAANLNAAGQDVETTTALLSMMANQGLKGSEAGTALTAVMRDMTAKMDEGAIAIGDTSVQIMDANGNYRDLTDILLDVEAATDGMGDAERAMALSTTFTADSIKALNLLLNAGVIEAENFEEELRNSSGTAENMAEIMNDNLNGDLTALGSQFEGVQIAIYEKFEPALRAGVDVLSKLLDAVTFVVDHSTEFTAALTAMAAGVAAYLAYTTALTVMTEGWKALTIVTKAQAAAQTVLNTVMSANPIGLVIAAIAALVAAFIYLWNNSEEFREFWIGLWEKIKEVAGAAFEAIKEFFTNAWENITETWSVLSEFFSGLWEGIKTVFSVIADWINENVFQPIIKFFEPVITFFAEAWTVIKGLAEGSWKAIKAIWSVVKKWFDDNVITPVKKFFSDLWEGIKTAASTAWNGIKEVWNVVSGWFNDNIISPVKNFFTEMWDKLKSGASDAWEGIKSVFGVVADWFEEKFSNAWEKVKGVFSTGGKIFDGIKDGIVSAFKTVVNAIIKGINKVIAIPFNSLNNILNKVRNIEVAGIMPFDGLWKENPFTVPQIPELAQGGVLKRGQVGLLEGNGAEAVVPLENNKKWIAATAKALKGALVNEGILGGVGDTINNYNFTQNNTSPKALSRLEIYRQTKNQLTLARGGLA